MKGMRSTILTMQYDLNKLMMTEKSGIFTTQRIYNLSLKLDEEIVKYYRQTVRPSA